MKALRKKDLRPRGELTEAFFRATNAHLSARDFALKWKGSRRGSAFQFLRSFPHAFHLDLADVERARHPGRQVFCLGDPHPDNFGFVTFGHGPEYVFDDLEDAGPGWASIDALRYFSSLRFLSIPESTESKLMNLYVAITFDRDHPRRFPLHLVPDIASATREEVLRWSDGSELRLGSGELEAVADGRRSDIFTALAEEERATGFRARSVARRLRTRSGSAGPSSFVVLGEDADGRLDLLELEELPPAATTWARRLHEPEDRISRAVRVLWRGHVPRHHGVVWVGSRDFLLRTRLGKARIDVGTLPPPHREAVLEAQVSILARTHRGAYSREESEWLVGWLKKSASVIHRRYAAVHRKIRK